MTEYQLQALNTIRSQPDCERAVIFLHGFSGDRDDTWDRLPGLLGTAVADWDIYTLGYVTTFLPDFLGVWSADPDLPILATMMTTQASIDPLRRYGSLALVAHSMGGLIVQRALVDEPELADRTDKVILFGTPSAGLHKASWLVFWKRQLRNMARADSGFYAHSVVSVCRKMDVRFSITLRQHKSLHNVIEAIPEEDWTPIPYWMDGAADVAETTYTPFQSEPDAAPVRLIVRRVKPTPGSQLALFATYSYHGFITDRDGETLELEADHRRHAEIENGRQRLHYSTQTGLGCQIRIRAGL